MVDGFPFHPYNNLIFLHFLNLHQLAVSLLAFNRFLVFCLVLKLLTQIIQAYIVLLFSRSLSKLILWIWGGSLTIHLMSYEASIPMRMELWWTISIIQARISFVSWSYKQIAFGSSNLTLTHRNCIVLLLSILRHLIPHDFVIFNIRLNIAFLTTATRGDILKNRATNFTWFKLQFGAKWSSLFLEGSLRYSWQLGDYHRLSVVDDVVRNSRRYYLLILLVILLLSFLRLWTVVIFN